MSRTIEVLLGVLTLVYKLLESLVMLVIPRYLLFKKVDKDIVLITGGGSGIGRQMAIKFAQLGSKVVVWDVNKDGYEETVRLVKENGGQATGYLVDVTDRHAVYATADTVRKEVGKVSILINNAGLVGGKRLLDLPDEQIEKVFQVNAISHFWTCKAFLPDMMAANKGHLVNVASMAGFFGVEKLSEYCASKHAVLGFTESMVMELRYGGFPGVQVTAVCPMAISTGFFDGFQMGPIPMLDTQYVVDEIIAAVLSNQKILLLPKYMNLLVMAKGLFPTEAAIILADIFGSSNAMKSFRGRSDQTKSQQQNGQATNGRGPSTSKKVK